MSSDLKLCPFCGSEPRLDQRVTQSLWNSTAAVFSHVTCDECGISGQDFCDDPDGEEATEWWNRRSQPSEEFNDSQWWFKELEQAVSNGTLSQRRALEVVRNLLSNVNQSL